MIYFFKLTCRMRTPVKGPIDSGQKQTAMPSDLQLDNGIAHLIMASNIPSRRGIHSYSSDIIGMGDCGLGTVGKVFM